MPHKSLIEKMKFKIVFSVFIFVHLQLGILDNCYGRGKPPVSDLRDLFEANSASLATRPSVESIWLSEPAIASYLAVGTALIGKMYFNWINEVGAVNTETIEWLKRFNENKNLMETQHPDLGQIEIEYLVIKKMQGKDHSLDSLLSCKSCGHAHTHHHHHHKAHGEAKNNSRQYESALNEWLKVMHEIGHLTGENSDSLEQLRSLEQRSQSGEWTDSLLRLVGRQIDLQLDWLQDSRVPLNALKADFGESPLYKLQRLRSKFFEMNRPHIKNFLMGAVSMLVRSGKLLVWDYTLRPAFKTFQSPRHTFAPLTSRLRISGNERGRLNSTVVSTLGVGLFFAYEFALHGILQIHTFCNHSLQLSLAMATAGVAFDVIRQPFLLVRLLPAHFTLIQRARIGVSIALKRWQMARFKANSYVHYRGSFAELSHSRFMEKIGGNLSSRDKLVELYLNGPLWGKTAQLIVDTMNESKAIDIKTSPGRFQNPIMKSFSLEVEKLFSEQLTPQEKLIIISETLTGLKIYSETIYHTLIGMSHLTRFAGKDLKLGQKALGQARRNLTLVEELLLVLAHVDKEKARNIFMEPEIVARELRDLLETFNELRKIVLDLNRDSMNQPQLALASPRKTFIRLPNIFSSLKSNHTSEFSERLNALLARTKEDTLRLRSTRIKGFNECSALLASRKLTP